MKRALDMLPPMRCDRGCGECCGPVPVTESEYRKVVFVARAKKLPPKRQGITCPFFLDGTCAVYDARPFACRLFGHVPGMTCERGYNTNITPSEEAKLLRSYGNATRLLHEALVELGVVATIEEALAPLDAVPDATSDP